MNPLKPYPDEFFLGYLGRLERILGTSRLQNLVRELGGPVAPNLRPVIAAAKIAGLSVETFLTRHTLTAVTHCTARAEDGTLLAEAISKREGNIGWTNEMLRVLCPTCIRKDQDRARISYWHRSHQAVGIVLCPIHGEMLREVTGSRAWYDSPACWLDRSTALGSIDLERWAQQSEIAKRYNEVLSWLFQTGRGCSRTKFRGRVWRSWLESQRGGSEAEISVGGYLDDHNAPNISAIAPTDGNDRLKKWGEQQLTKRCDDEWLEQFVLSRGRAEVRSHLFVSRCLNEIAIGQASLKAGARRILLACLVADSAESVREIFSDGRICLPASLRLRADEIVTLAA